MKILNKTKRAVPPHPQVVEVISGLLTTPNQELAQALAQIDCWKWPRSDLNAWIEVLNKFDTILEEVIRDYEVAKLQIKDFTLFTKKTICEVLRFERLLLENSTNRKMFNSYDRLNALLFTSDLDILILALNLLLRPAQQYSAQPSVSHALNISTPRLQSLAKRWPNLREHGVGLLELSCSSNTLEVEALPMDAREVNYSFYRTDTGKPKEEDEKMDMDVPEGTQISTRKSSKLLTITPSGAVSVHIDEQTLESKDTMTILAEAIEGNNFSDDDRFELLCRIRAAKVVTKGHEVDREKLVLIRLLAIAIFGHTHPEAQAMSSLFLYEPDLIIHVAELLQIDRTIPTSIQTAAIAALDALARYRNKLQEVLTAVNAGVNHGILMALVRMTVADISKAESTLQHSFVEALLSFLTFIASHATGGNMIVGAGLVPLLIQIIENRLPQRLQVVSKTMQLVDNVIYSFANAFQLFCTARGVDVLVERIGYEVDLDIKEYGHEQRSHEILGSYGHLPVARAAILKHTLRSLHRMMQSSGTAEGLRGLIDTSILQSIRKIIKHRDLFGPSVLPIAINIMATFVHNEPTSLTIIQEAGLPDVLYQAIEVGLEPAIEVIQAIPNAIGALCLNTVGQEQLSRYPSIIPGILSIFMSERHLKLLMDKENAILIGTAVDELIRHHPSLKPTVFESILTTLSKLEMLSEAWTPTHGQDDWYRLLPLSDSGHAGEEQAEPTVARTDENGQGTPMEGIETGDNAPSAGGDNLDLTATYDIIDDAIPFNSIVPCIDVFCRFMEGLFQHAPHCRDFISNFDGLRCIGKLSFLPCYPWDYAESAPSASYFQLWQTMTEVSTNECISFLANQAKASLEETRDFWESLEGQSKLLSLVDIQPEQEFEANVRFRKLVRLYTHVSLLADTVGHGGNGYTHGRAALGALQTLMGSNAGHKVIPDLGALHRASLWENIVLKVGLSSKGIPVAITPNESSREGSPTQTPNAVSHAGNASSAPTSSSWGRAPAEVTSPDGPSNDSFGPKGSREYNAKALQQLAHGIPAVLAPFWQAVVKMFYARRNPDHSQRKQISDSASILAQILLKHLKQEGFDDTISAYTYYSVMLGLVTVCLIDERTSQNTLHTVELVQFYRIGGLDAILDVCKKFTDTIATTMQVPPDDRSDVAKKELDHAFGGLKVALHILLVIVSSKPLFESGQTLLLVTRDKKDTDPDYFEPHNFLVKLRLAALPLLRSLWEAPWLVSAPLSVSKSVVRTVIELCVGDNEEPQAEPDGGTSNGAVASGSQASGRPAGLDEDRIRQLTDMGFPRSAAERALTRTHNNINAATELLLAHPFPLPPDPEPAQPDSVADATGPEEAESVPATSNADAILTPPEPVEDDPVQAVPKEVMNPEAWRKALNDLREPLRAGISRRALSLVDYHQALIFDLHGVWVQRSSVLHEQNVRNLVDDVKAFTSLKDDRRDQPLANRFRILALILLEVPTTVNQELRDELMEYLMANLELFPLAAGDGTSVPKWLATHFLVTEALFTLGSQVRAITLPKEGEPIEPQGIISGPLYPEARLNTFDYCLHLLAIDNLSRDELLSVLRLLVLLTRDHQKACQFVKRGGVGYIFRRLKTSSINGFQRYIAIILRHVIEDTAVLSHLIKHYLKRYFSHPRTRVADIGTFIRNCGAMALRDPELFVQATASLCLSDRPFSTTPHISLKPDIVDGEPKDATNTEETDMQVDTPMTSSHLLGQSESATQKESLEAIVQFLVGELIRVSKISTSSPESINAPGLARDTPQSSTSSASAGKDKDHVLRPNNEEDMTEPTPREPHEYLCFVMQCLTELLFSYDSCKAAFLSFSHKRRPSAKEAPAKHKTAVQFLLSDLITFGTMNPNSEAQNRILICNWAMPVIVALCVDTSISNDGKETSAELVSIRKHVLEAVSRSIKDLPPTEDLDARYGRLLALSDLCNRLLTVRFNAMTRKQPEEIPTHIAKIMLEKHFVASLTNALSEVDLNYPNVRNLVVSILKPLEHLSKIAIKMSRASGKAKEVVEGKKETTDSVETEEDVDETGREETPDLYRHSALGMYGGEMEDVNFTVEDDGDEGEEEEDVEMDFGDENRSEATDTDEEVDTDNIEDETQESQEGWDDNEDAFEPDLVENEDENDDDGDDDDDDDDDEDEPGESNEEILWQDIRGEVVAEDEQGENNEDGDNDDDDDDRTGEAIQIIHHAERDEEADMLSDDEDSLAMLETGDGAQAVPNFVFGMGNTFGGGVLEREGSLFAPRRHRGLDDNVQVFTRARSNNTAPADATIHPLLLDTTAPPHRIISGQARNPRRGQRTVVTGTTTELLRTIDELLGSGAAQLFHQAIRGRAFGGPETIRVDVPGAVLNLDRTHVQRRPDEDVVIQAEAVRKPESREFDPLLTPQRWAEESKVLHGRFVNERAQLVINHVVLALLPAAVEAEKEAKKREEQELTKRREAEAKAEAEAEATTRAEQRAREEAEEKDRGAAEDTASTMESDNAAGHPQDENNQTSRPDDVDTEMTDASIAPESPHSNAEGTSPQPTTNAALAPITEIIEPGPSASASTDAPQPAERVTVMIHGSPVDITDTGIDPTFLEALPDDMREEVLNQHVRDRRASRTERPPDSQISAEFLDALPPDIRAEIIQQERLEQSRRRTEAPSHQPAGLPSDIDPASFIASLDPQLRQVVLLDQDDGFIQTLPSHMIAEVGGYREDSPLPRRQPAARPAAPRSAALRKVPPSHDAIQLLDKAGIAILVRLLFFPQVLRKNLLSKVLVNLCENAKTRTELFSLLLKILQDGTGDLAAVDKSFSQMSVRQTKPPSQTSKITAKQRTNLEHTNSLALSNFQPDAVPDLIAHRCLENLTFIVSSNESFSLFFLTEHELPAGLRRPVSKKGKGKEKQTPHTYYPIVLLLGLLDRQSLLKTPSIMESVVGLLAMVTRPLTTIKDTQKKVDETPTVPTSQSLPLVQTTSDAPQTTADVARATLQNATPDESKTPESPREVDENVLLANPPQIPHSALRLIVNILTIGECSGRTFQQSLALIQHLSFIPDARDVIAQELKSKAQEFGQNLITHLDELAAALRNARDTLLLSSVASKFSPASSEQAKLLRVLKTIDYMYSPKSSSPEPSNNGDEEKVQGIYESFHFSPLWRRLGDCLAIIEETPDTEHIATVLLPLIESLMVVCKYVGSKTPMTGPSRALRASASPRSPTTPRESMEDLFVTFTDGHRKILNLMVRNNPSLMSGSFSLLVHNPRVLDFDNKRNYFNQQLHRRPNGRDHHGTLQLNVRRARVFEDSFQYIQRRTGDQVKYGKLSVRFYDEEGVDAGGVTREWFQILARQMFDPNNALFQPCAADRQTYQPNKNSWVNPEHLSFFKFVGRIIGKAIYDGRLLDAYFARSLYRQILGKPVDYRDVEWIDPEYYNSLCWILENDPTPLELTFSVEADAFGVNRIAPLKTGGETLPVTQENKREFVQLSAQYRLYSSIKDQIENLLTGFYEIIPKDLVTIFNEQELELLISGTPDIDVDEWRAATEYVGYHSSDPVIVWWWRALKSFSRDERAKVLSFATGTSRVPLNGFVDLQGVQGVQRFSIHRAYGESDRLPQAHTCFNQIDLPSYSSYEMLRQQLLLAINEGGEGFGFA